MHRCLYVREIVERIVNDILESNYAWRYETLADLAVVCKAFYEPSMNAFWRDLDGLGPLVRCLPEHTWQMVHGTVVSPFRSIQFITNVIYFLGICEGT